MVVAAMLAMPTGASAMKIAGKIQGTVPMGGMYIVLSAARPGKQRLYGVGFARSRRDGSFSLRYEKPPRGSIKYLIATRPGPGAEAGSSVSRNSYRLAAALGSGDIPRRAAVNERTTVAFAFAMAQFVYKNGRIAGKNPGLRNAAAMTRNLVGRRNGGLSPVLRRFPNGRSTSTWATFDSLANLVGSCRTPDRRCARLLELAATPRGEDSTDTLAAMVAIARYPWHHAPGLFKLSRLARKRYRPVLGPRQAPKAWTLALRFEGKPETMNGPGAFAIDARGSLWVANNYEYSRKRLFPVCAAENVLRFTPTGRNFPGAPYTGGGLTGAGFGIGIAPNHHVWVGNFGFAAPECAQQPPHNSVSEFTPTGEPLSPPLTDKGTKKEKGGYEDGDIYWPQSTISDREGNIWIANCGNDSVTKYPGGSPGLAENFKHIGLSKPFGAVVNPRGQVFVTGNDSSTVAILEPDGKPAPNSPISGYGINRPMGNAIDSRGYVWVANSGKIPAPCPVDLDFVPRGGTTTLLKPNGEPFRAHPFRGAGLRTPWGVAVDGDDTVWFANFTGQRLSQMCGTQPKLCPPGKQRIGASISPRGSGYGFDGLVRNTGVAIDPSGNVWLTNNWKTISIQANPGGYQIVAYLGLAAPVKTPLIGPPEQP